MPGVLIHIFEVAEATKCLSSLYIFLYDFFKTSGGPGGSKHFSEDEEATESLSSL